MADKAAFQMTTGIPGFLAEIIYNDVNLAIQRAQWTVPAGLWITVLIWDTNIDPVDPVYVTVQGEGSDSQIIPGNYKLVEVTEGGWTRLAFPANISYRFSATNQNPGGGDVPPDPEW